MAGSPGNPRCSPACWLAIAMTPPSSRSTPSSWRTARARAAFPPSATAQAPGAEMSDTHRPHPPPAARARSEARSVGSPDRVDVEPDPVELVGIQEVPAVEEERWPLHVGIYPLPVELPILVPVGEERDRMGSLRRQVRVRFQCDPVCGVGEVVTGTFQSPGVSDREPGVLGE